MAKKSMRLKAAKPNKFAVRQHNRCNILRATRAYMRKFGMCRICFRKLALEGNCQEFAKASCDMWHNPCYEFLLMEGGC